MAVDDDLRARLDIADVIYGWADCLDRREFQRLGEIWAPECRFSTYHNHADFDADRPAIDGADCPDSIAKLGGLLGRIGQTHHLIGNVRVLVDGDQAKAECLVRAYHAANPVGPQGFWESLARMYVELRRETGWRIVRQDYVVLVGLGTQDIFRRSWANQPA